MLLTTIVIIVLASAVHPSKIVRHPRFKNKNQLDIVDTGKWHSSYTTSIRGLDARFTGHQHELLLQFEIEHLPDKDSFQLEIGVQCEPNGAETRLQSALPFQFNKVAQCSSFLPFTVTTVHSQWLTADNQPMYSLALTLRRVPNEDTFYETLKNHVRLKFTFHNDKWRLESNSIYLWSWDGSFKYHHFIKSVDNKMHYFLTEASINLMLSMNLNKSKPFDSVQFIEPTMISLVNGSSEYVQNYINIEAIMLLGIGIASTCHTSQAEFTVVFGTRKAGVFEEHDKMLKVAQVDGRTGKLTYSRFGLSAAMTRFNAQNKEQVKYSRGPGSNRLRICAGQELSHSLTPVSGFKNVVLQSNPNLTYQEYGSLNNDCHIVGPSTRQVVLFAKSGFNRLICPIICTNIEQTYLFYKENIALTPNPRHDRTSHLNGSIFAYKQGTAIDIREAATHEDEGQYRCSAGTKTVKFDVSVVSMPYFTMRLLNGKTLIGSLPNKIYALEGEGYLVSCTVYFTGMTSVTLLPEFYLQSDDSGGKFQWKKESAATFIAEVEECKENMSCKATISENNSKYQKSVTLSVQGVRREGRLRQSLFNHRFVCSASASDADTARLGIKDYSAQSGADVYFIPRPSIEDFDVNVNNCCLKPCPPGQSGNCKIEIYLKNDWRDFLANIGIKISAAFQASDMNVFIDATNETFDAALAKAIIESTGSMNSMSNEQKSKFILMAPIFRYHFATDPSQETSFTVLRGQGSETNADPKCTSDPQCIYSTGFDSHLTNSLSVAGAIARTIPAKIPGNSTSEFQYNLNLLYNLPNCNGRTKPFAVNVVMAIVVVTLLKAALRVTE